MPVKYVTLLILVVVLTSCVGQTGPAAEVQEVPMTLSITSTGFTHGQPIPSEYACDGAGISPPLTWSGAPSGTTSFALIMDDPDAPMGTFVHWAIYNLPASASGLQQAVSKDAALADGSQQGRNSGGRTGYTGPCPPGGTHRYFFRLYALDGLVDLPGAGKDQLLKAMHGHILAQGELMGTYSR